MPSAKNVEAVAELSDKLSRSTVAIATEFMGIPVNTVTELRRHLRASGAEYKVVKNTLMERTADAVGKAEVKQILEGPTAVVFGYGDPIEPIKVLTDYIRANRIPVNVRAAALDGRVFRGEEIMRLAQLPSRETLVAQVVTMMAAPISRLVNVLNSPLAGLAIVLQQRAKQLEGPEG